MTGPPNKLQIEVVGHQIKVSASDGTKWFEFFMARPQARLLGTQLIAAADSPHLRLVPVIIPATEEGVDD
jgi:hypothetical protein